MTDQRYRAEAARLREEAARTRFPDIREQLLTLAAQFDRLAADVEPLQQPRRRRAPGSQDEQGDQGES